MSVVGNVIAARLRTKHGAVLPYADYAAARASYSAAQRANGGWSWHLRPLDSSRPTPYGSQFTTAEVIGCLAWIVTPDGQNLDGDLHVDVCLPCQSGARCAGKDAR